MDYLRSCYRSDQRAYRDAPEVLTAGRWHWCVDGALALGIPHIYAASIWDDHAAHTETLTLGEVAQGAWSNGQADPRFHGLTHCGPADWWENGSPLDAQGTPEADETGWVPCCGVFAQVDETMRWREEDGAPDIPFVSDMIIAQDTGLKLESTGPNQARLSLDPPTDALALLVQSQTQPVFLLPPADGSPGAPIWRTLVKADFNSGVIEARALEWTATPDAGILRKSGAASGEWEHHFSSILGQVPVVTAAGPRKVAEWTTLTLSLIADAGTAAGMDAGDFAAAVHTHTVADLTDAGDIVTHDASEFQPIDAELTALAGISANGLLARTGAGTAAARTLTAGSTQVQVANGDGAAGNPTVDLLRYPGQALGFVYTATDESTSAAGPTNLTTDANFSINTGATRTVEFEAFCETYNATVPAVHSLTIEVDGTDTTFSLLVDVANTIFQLRARVVVSVATGAKTIRLQYGTNNGTAHFLRRSLTAIALE